MHVRFTVITKLLPDFHQLFRLLLFLTGERLGESVRSLVPSKSAFLRRGGTRKTDKIAMFSIIFTYS